MMSRRNVSPMKPKLPQPQNMTIPTPRDQRDVLINKLRQELIIARGKAKQMLVLENYQAELNQKMRILTQDLRRKQNQLKSKADLSQKNIIDLKRQVQLLKTQLKNKSLELGQKQSSLLQIKRYLNKRIGELQKIKNQTMFMKSENDRLIQQYDSYIERSNNVQIQLAKTAKTSQCYQTQISKLNLNISKVKGYITQLNDQARILKDKLKNHQQQNNNISDDLYIKQDNIDDLQKKFSDQHDNIKNQIDLFIQLQNRNQKTLTEIRHKINLNKAENQKSNQLNNTLQKVQKVIYNLTKQNKNVADQNNSYVETNNQYINQNEQLTRNLKKCQIHLENLIKYNAQIRDDLDHYLREDQQIVGIIKKKRTSGFSH